MRNPQRTGRALGNFASVTKPIVLGCFCDKRTAYWEPRSPPDTNTGVDAFADEVLSDGGFGTGVFADEVLSEDEVDFDPALAGNGGHEVTAATLADIPTRKRKHMTITRAEGAGGSATATTDLDPNSARGGGDTATATNDFDPISDWEGGDEVTAADALTPGPHRR